MKVACLMTFGNRRYRWIADAMAEGIRKCGDQAVICPAAASVNADAAILYGWKFSAYLKKYPQYAYADLGFWQREKYYRITVGGWGSEGYVSGNLPASRMESLGVQIKPWRESGDEIVVFGSSRKSAREHGFEYMEWERKAVESLRGSGKRIVYRPKPTDKEKQPIQGCGYDERPLEESLAKSWAVVTHHSNAAVMALAAGVPVHCQTGAAAAFSVPIASLAAPELLPGREQFLADVAWLQWTLDEMRSGECWRHLKERRLIC